MLSQERIAGIIDAQRKYFVSKRTDQVRDALPHIPLVKDKATLIAGMRRCGKCTLLLQWQKEQEYKDVVYLNFEDICLAGFTQADFVTLREEITRRGTQTVFFDEIHIMPGWEAFVKDLLAQEVAVFIADTNASLCQEPFIRALELFPFSYREYLHFSRQEPSVESLARYMKVGGIPKMVRNEGTSIMNNLLDDIVVRDIAVRRGIREVDALRQMAVFLLSHTGTEVTANSLVGMFGLKSCATITEFFKCFRESYLMEMIPLYSESASVRARNAKRVYAMDVGLINIACAQADPQSRLENLVFAHLRRTCRDIAYYNQKRVGECHFITIRNNVPYRAVHVSRYLSEYNKFLIYQQLANVLPRLGLKEATVVTMEQQQEFYFKGITIHIVPAYQELG